MSKRDKFIKKQRINGNTNRSCTLFVIDSKTIRGHNEKTNNVHKGLFLDIVSLLHKYYSIFNQNLLSGSQNALYISNCIQNDCIQSVILVIKRQL